jgi:hypothetical protein
MKKMLFLLITINLIAKNYLSTQDFKQYNFNLFIGGDIGFNYINASKTIDNLDYALGYYIGTRFTNDYEIILKQDTIDANDYKIKNNTLRLNIPLTSLFTDRFYLGLSYGKNKFTFKQKTINNIDVTNKTNNNKYYGIAYGKRYKFAKFFYVRIEAEYLKYNTSIQLNSTNNFNLNSSLNFNYFVEYNFY